MASTRRERSLRGTAPHIAVAAVIGVGFATCLSAALALEVGELASPGPGWWPAVSAAVGCALSALLIAGLFAGVQEAPENPLGDVRWLRVAIFVLAVIAFLVLYPFVGFLPAGVPLALILLRFASGVSWLSSAILAVTVPAALYVLFSGYLRVPL
ncbi:tripartite tricarboxylate transporter TctB family protein [Brevibacterium album]|uniref:tripartite tricarboxylate transporter TctB family protein n=1 Tax=Brevibacterium album TaxID=417948 RepID=UPI00048C0C29|nr:tripartite tricarboxylate transporter TctB family protein [Brevibacterium album]